MPLWAWIAVIIAALLSVSLLVGFLVAAILGNITREMSGLLELEEWADAPLMEERRTEIELESTRSASGAGRAHA